MNPASRGRLRLRAGFWSAGSLLLLFIALPVIVLLLGTTPASLAQTMVDTQVLRAVRTTLAAAGLATLLGLGLGIPLAYVMARQHFPGKRFVLGLLGLPVIIPHTSAGVALLLTFGARGPLGRPLASLGLLFTDRLAGIVVAMLFVGVPLLVTNAREAFAGVGVDLEEAALVDGASGWRTFWQVTMPLARRGVAAGALMMWARGISEFGAVVLLSYHPRTLATLVYERFQGFGLSSATPLAALLVLLSLAVFAVLGAWLSPSED